MTTPVVVQMHDFTEQFESGAFSDCRIKCGARVWNLHKVILTARCRFFEAALGGIFKESQTSEVFLDEEDPEILDQALRYIYSCNASHVDKLIIDDDNSDLSLKAYKTYIPLYVLADFLQLPGLCRDLHSRLHDRNRRLAAHIQRLPKRDGETSIHLGDAFTDDFVECARLAYSIPAQQTEKDCSGRPTPGGLRSIFVELFEFVGFQPLDDTLDALSLIAPGLLADVIKAMRHAHSFIPDENSENSTCVECGINPLTGVGQAMPTREWGQDCVARFTSARKGNFWARKGLCYECSVYYPKWEASK
ncbi:BTB/POZ protein [Podospora aff. communis PSN243]|uniref:BTB/POZ protein n=1 Tax=Podospora aff. communis PSN243 TaxID=3040156 RepID=A0AAV9G8P7_9PEZI|nr:BTB/POZ protein [Podospora aff. communis PSN243]